MRQHPVVSPRSRICIATLATLVIAAGGARAADEPPKPDPDISAAQAARNAPPPIPFNSGASPREFGIDRSKITLELRPNGGRLYHLNGQGMEAIVAHVRPDGTIEYRCSDRADDPIADTGAAANVHEK